MCRAMSREKKSTTVYLERVQLAALERLHQRTRVPIAVYLREGVDLVLARYGEPKEGDDAPPAPAPGAARG